MTNLNGGVGGGRGETQMPAKNKQLIETNQWRGNNRELRT